MKIEFGDLYVDIILKMCFWMQSLPIPKIIRVIIFFVNVPIVIFPFFILSLIFIVPIMIQMVWEEF